MRRLLVTVWRGKSRRLTWFETVIYLIRDKLAQGKSRDVVVSVVMATFTGTSAADDLHCLVPVSGRLSTIYMANVTTRRSVNEATTHCSVAQ